MTLPTLSQCLTKSHPLQLLPTESLRPRYSTRNPHPHIFFLAFPPHFLLFFAPSRFPSTTPYIFNPTAPECRHPLIVYETNYLGCCIQYMTIG